MICLSGGWFFTILCLAPVNTFEVASNMLTINRIFKDCTIYIPNIRHYNAHNKITWRSFSTPYFKSCKILKNCVTLQTKPTKPISNSLTDLTVAALREQKNFTKLFNQAISSHRHLLPCLLQFPEVTVAGSTLRISPLDNVLWFDSDYHYGKLYIRSFQIFGIFPMPEQCHHSCTVYIGRLARGRFVLLDELVSKAYLGVTNLQLEFEILPYTVTEKPLYTAVLLLFLVSLPDVQYLTQTNIWTAYTNFYANLPKVKQSSEYSAKNVWGKEDSDWDKYLFIRLMYLHVNCSEKYACEGVDRLRFDYWDDNYFINYKYTSYGLQINKKGIQYVQLKGMGTSSENRLDALLHPLSLITWLLLIASALALCVMMKLTMLSISWSAHIFWLYGTLFEQEDAGWQNAKTSQRVCFSLWLVLSIFTRQFYTSSIYSDMTAQPDPFLLPCSLTDRVQAGPCEQNHLFLTSQYTYKNIAVANMMLKHAYQLPSLQFPVQVWEKTNVIRQLENNTCMLRQAMQFYQPRTMDNGNNIKYSEVSPAQNLMVFFDVSDPYEYVCIRYFVPLLNNRILYENNQEAFQKVESIYRFRLESTFSELFLKYAGYLYHSGIVHYLEEVVYRANYLNGVGQKLTGKVNQSISVNLKALLRATAEADIRRSGIQWRDIRHHKVLSGKHTLLHEQFAAMQLEDSKLVWQVFLIGCVMALIAKLGEHLTSCYNR